jgi:hypothetical protein
VNRELTATRLSVQLTCIWIAVGAMVLVAAGPASAQLIGPLVWGAPTSIATPLEFGRALTGMACPSSSLCVAVDSRGETISSVDPGEASANWDAKPVDPNTICNESGGECSAAPLVAVSCPTVLFCAAVDEAGYVLWSTEPTGGAGSWHSTRIALPYKRGSFYLRGISCPSQSLCVALGTVGSVIVSTDPTGGPDSWHAMTVDTVACPAGSRCNIDGSGPLPLMTALACASVSLCVAGDFNGSVVVATDPLGAWSYANIDPNTTELIGEPVGSPPPQAALESLSCPSTSLCLAGDQVGGIFALREPTNPTSTWTTVREATGGPIEPVITISQISCPSTSRCVAVGASPFAGRSPWVAVSDSPGTPGTWARESYEPVACAGSETCALTGVVCPSEILCIASDYGGQVIVGHASTLTPPPPGAPSTTSPLIADVRQSHASWREHHHATSTWRHAKRIPLGSTFTYTLNEPAQVAFTFTQRLTGRQLHGKCVVENRKNRPRPPCRRRITRGTISTAAHEGKNELVFLGRLSRESTLPPGSYSVTLIATTTAGARSLPVSLTFTIAR